jgi:hypothetical protein
MASDVQDGGQIPKKYNFEILPYFCIRPFAMSFYFDQQNESNSHLAKIAKNGGSIQNGGPKSVFLALLWKLTIFFQTVFCIRLVLPRRKFCREKVVKKKSKIAAKKSISVAILNFIDNFFSQNVCLANINLMLKTN